MEWPIRISVEGRFPSLNEYISASNANGKRSNYNAANAMKRREQVRVRKAIEDAGFPALEPGEASCIPEEAYPLEVTIACWEHGHRRDWDGIASMAAKFVLDGISRPHPRSKDAKKPCAWLIPDDGPSHVWPVYLTVGHTDEFPGIGIQEGVDVEIYPCKAYREAHECSAEPL